MRKLNIAISTAIIAIAAGFTAMAGTWKSDANGWWYDMENGSYPTNKWEWIDGNNDGVSECYYFDGNGYCLVNTTTPDGYYVNSDGAWVVNGIIQTKKNDVTALAIKEYRNALLNNTWNIHGQQAQEFAVVDLYQDGVKEVFVRCRDNVHDDYYAYAAHLSTFMCYSNGLKAYRFGDEDCSIELFAAVNPIDGRVLVERSRGKNTLTLYQFKNDTLIKLDSVCVPYMTEEERIQAKMGPYANLFRLNYVDMTQENLDTYLSGNGLETGYTEVFSNI